MKDLFEITSAAGHRISFPLKDLQCIEETPSGAAIQLTIVEDIETFEDYEEIRDRFDAAMVAQQKRRDQERREAREADKKPIDQPPQTR